MNGLTTPHYKKKSPREYEFPDTASEIALLDRLGHVIWHQRRSDPATPLRWLGMDLYGTHVNVGAYTFKICFHNAEPVYFPFIFTHD